MGCAFYNAGPCLKPLSIEPQSFEPLSVPVTEEVSAVPPSSRSDAGLNSEPEAISIPSSISRVRQSLVSAADEQPISGPSCRAFGIGTLEVVGILV
jgi:hypothetical protein